MEGLLAALFVKDVYAMREAQRRYFKTRTKDDLVKSKEQEALVDKWIRDYQQGLLNYEEEQ